MNKDTFLKIISLYKSEKNLNRLIYRLIKYESEENSKDRSKWLSRNDIWRISQKIIFTPTQLEKENNRIANEKKKILNEKIAILEKSGYRDIEITKDNCLKYKDKESDYVYYNSFPVEFNLIDNTYLIEMKNKVNNSIDYLLDIEYIKGYKIKNINPYKKHMNLGTTIRFKAIK